MFCKLDLQSKTKNKIRNNDVTSIVDNYVWTLGLIDDYTKFPHNYIFLLYIDKISRTT